LVFVRRRKNTIEEIHDENPSDCRPLVLFTPSRLTGDYGFTHIDSRKPLASIVAHVFNDGLVNLSVFDSNGTPFSRTSVPLVQAGEAKPEHGYFCSWMPYQVGQGAKAAASA
jgi:hypothetical protein